MIFFMNDRLCCRFLLPHSFAMLRTSVFCTLSDHCSEQNQGANAALSRPPRERRSGHQEDQKGNLQFFLGALQTLLQHHWAEAFGFVSSSGAELHARVALPQEVEDHRAGLHLLSARREHEEEEPDCLQHGGGRDRVREGITPRGSRCQKVCVCVVRLAGRYGPHNYCLRCFSTQQFKSSRARGVRPRTLNFPYRYYPAK